MMGKTKWHTKDKTTPRANRASQQVSKTESAAISKAVDEALAQRALVPTAPAEQQPARNTVTARRVRRGTNNRKRQDELKRRARIQGERRARRLPFLATLLTAMVGYTAWGVTALAAVFAGAQGRVIAATITAAVASTTILLLRWAKKNRLTQQWRRRFWTATSCAAGWVTAAAVGGIGWMMLAILAGGSAAISAKWLAAHVVDQPPEHAPAPADTEPDQPDPGKEIAALWRNNVAKPTGAVPGSLLTDRDDPPFSVRYTLNTEAGSMEFSELLSRRGKIAAGLRRGTQDIQLDPDPDGDASKAILTVVLENPLEGKTTYTGPSYNDGHIPVGPFVDGNGVADFTAYDGTGVYGGAAAGEPGSGKSSCFENVGLSLRGSGEWLVVYCDGDAGQGSSTLMNEHMDWVEAGIDGAMRQLQALERVATVRSMLKNTLTVKNGRQVTMTDLESDQPLKHLRPSPEFPGLMFMIDELHYLARYSEFMTRLEKLVRIGRKLGIAVFVATHSLGVKDFGGSTSLRGFLASRNAFAFRNMSKQEKNLVGEFGFDMASLPPGGGYAYKGGARPAMLRAMWTPDMAQHATGLPHIEADPDTHAGLGEDYAARTTDPVAARRAAFAQLEQFRATHHLNNRTSTPTTHEDSTDNTTPAPLVTLLNRVPRALDGHNVVPLQPTPETPTNPAIDALTANQRAVLDALRAGHTRSGQIASATTLSAPAVSKALAALAERSLATKRGHGEWQPTAARSEAA